MKVTVLYLVLLLAALPVTAQEDLFGKVPKQPARKGMIFAVNANYDKPLADMADRFGASARIGPSFMYKTTSNWLFGAKMDFIFGNRITQDSLLINVKDKYGEFITESGERAQIPMYERGYMIGLQAGKIINLSKRSGDNGLMLLTSAGFIQHKINIFVKQQDIPQIRGDYRKGYDRLTNGLFLEQFVGYTYFAKDGLLNFYVGFDAAFGFTQGRRDYLFDVKRPDDQPRLDILMGLRGGIYIPIFKRKSEELIFE